MNAMERKLWGMIYVSSLAEYKSVSDLKRIRTQLIRTVTDGDTSDDAVAILQEVDNLLMPIESHQSVDALLFDLNNSLVFSYMAAVSYLNGIEPATSRYMCPCSDVYDLAYNFYRSTLSMYILGHASFEALSSHNRTGAAAFRIMKDQLDTARLLNVEGVERAEAIFEYMQSNPYPSLDSPNALATTLWPDAGWYTVGAGDPE